MATESERDVNREQAPRSEARVREQEEGVLPFDAGEAVEVVSQWARENPHAAVAAAAGIGFLLGGGLSPRLVGAVGLMAARHYFKQSIGETIEQLVPREMRR
jgi:hypothetical protein